MYLLEIAFMDKGNKKIYLPPLICVGRGIVRDAGLEWY